jgi:hypothetical protein
MTPIRIPFNVRSGEASIGLCGQPANAESCQLVSWIVAGDDFEHAGGILDGAAQRSRSRIQARANHPRATDQFLGRRQFHKAVVLGGVMDGSPSFLSKPGNAVPAASPDRPLLLQINGSTRPPQ